MIAKAVNAQLTEASQRKLQVNKGGTAKTFRPYISIYIRAFFML